MANLAQSPAAAGLADNPGYDKIPKLATSPASTRGRHEAVGALTLPVGW